MTCGVTFALTIYAFTTKNDFTYCGPMLCVMGCALCMVGMFAMILNIPYFYYIYSTLGLVLYSFYLIYDT